MPTRPPGRAPARQAAALRRPPPGATRGPVRRVKLVERFSGRRVRSRTGMLRRFRSLLGLMVIGLVLATILAAVVAVIVGSIALAIQHALGT